MWKVNIVNTIITFCMLLNLVGCVHQPLQSANSNSIERIQMVPANILQRTFRVKIGDTSGTAFAIERNGRQYLISAAHVFAPIESGGVLEIKNQDKWVKYKSHWIGKANEPIDIAVISLEQQIAPLLPITAIGTKDVFVSRDLFFLGFPYEFATFSGTANAGFPIPLVKKAICAGLITSNEKSVVGLYLDGNNNHGFSGGPVVDTSSTTVQIVAVISGYGYAKEPVLDPNDKITKFYFRYNTGIIVTYDLQFALNIIDKNPKGFKL
jgi:S1-C subfamily serine protease